MAPLAWAAVTKGHYADQTNQRGSSKHTYAADKPVSLFTDKETKAQSH